MTAEQKEIRRLKRELEDMRQSKEAYRSDFNEVRDIGRFVNEFIAKGNSITICPGKGSVMLEVKKKGSTQITEVHGVTVIYALRYLMEYTENPNVKFLSGIKVRKSK